MGSKRRHETIQAPASETIQAPASDLGCDGERDETSARKIVLVESGGIATPSRYSLGDDDISEEEEEVAGCIRPSPSSVRIKRGPSGRFVGNEAETSSSVVGGRIKKGRGRGRKGKGVDTSWILTGSCVGGPRVPSAIPSFAGHMAYSYYLGLHPDRGALTAYHRVHKLKTLKEIPLTGDFGRLLSESDLLHLKDCMHSHLDMPLLSAFIERWQPDTNTFHLPFGEMTILLHDVEKIMRLKIDGEVCCTRTAEGVTPMDPIYFVSQLLAKTVEQLKLPFKGTSAAPIYKGGGVLAEAVSSVLHGALPQDRAQAYLVLLLSHTLFTDKSGSRVKPHVFPLVSDLNQVKRYAWGAGALAYLYRELGIASRTNIHGVAGSLTLLQTWIYEYFPCFRSSGDRLVVGQSEPRVLGWPMGPPFQGNVQRLLYYRHKLDSLTAGMVEWLPFGGENNINPRSLFSGFIRYMNIIEPYQPDRCLRQYGYVQVIPLAMPTPGFAYRPASGAKYIVEYDSITDHFWRSFEDHRVILKARSRPCDNFIVGVADDYLEWYLDRSHVKFIPETASDDAYNNVFRGHGDDHSHAELGRSLAGQLAPILNAAKDNYKWHLFKSAEAGLKNIVDQLMGCVGSRGSEGRGGNCRGRDTGRDLSPLLGVGTSSHARAVFVGAGSSSHAQLGSSSQVNSDNTFYSDTPKSDDACDAESNTE